MSKIAYKILDKIPQIVAGDKCYLKEIFHPDRDKVFTNHSLAWAFVEPGGKTLAHSLVQTETYLILKGTGKMHIDNEVFEAFAGASWVVVSNATQWIENTGKDRLEFIVVVDPPWQQADEAVFESGE